MTLDFLDCSTPAIFVFRKVWITWYTSADCHMSTVNFLLYACPALPKTKKETVLPD